ncbi:thermonuclease family protein [Pseudomonas entomophila]|jgi:endonuclease YncB( thermonuclease family)|uniref:thermonuclease family protein n=1 Tax=Pseudomonas entomophila TaxID=312306 RepID=UPI00215980E3|nr:thermonuclease family protein [Pseudomonas entomophila]
MANPLGFAPLHQKAPLVGAFFMAAIWGWPAQAEVRCAPPGRVQQAIVRQVVDGDTLRLTDGRSVRLIGINAPEIGRRGQLSEPFAEAARQRLRALVKANGGRLGLVVGKERTDHYGRLLAHAYGRDGQNLEARLLSEGLGYRVAIAPNVALNRCHRQAERQAREAGAGLWRRAVVRQAAELRRPGFAVVAGRVVQVRRQPSGVSLVLDDRLVVRVPDRLRDRLSMSTLERLRGRQVEVRGWVRERAGVGSSRRSGPRWGMSLTDPSMLEVR